MEPLVLVIDDDEKVRELITDILSAFNFRVALAETSEAGVAAIPLSAFYAEGFEQRIVRFCFAKKNETLLLALERLARM